MTWLALEENLLVPDLSPFLEVLKQTYLLYFDLEFCWRSMLSLAIWGFWTLPHFCKSGYTPSFLVSLIFLLSTKTLSNFLSALFEPPFSYCLPSFLGDGFLVYFTEKIKPLPNIKTSKTGTNKIYFLIVTKKLFPFLSNSYICVLNLFVLGWEPNTIEYFLLFCIFNFVFSNGSYFWA